MSKGTGCTRRSMKTVWAWSFACAAWTQQEVHRVVYKGVFVGEYIPDLVVKGALIVDSKTVDRITDHERGQMLNYLRITTLQVGVILNFKHARLEWERIVLSGEPGMNRIKRAAGAVERALMTPI